MQLPDKVWPKCIQVQGKHNRQGDLFLMEGAEAKEHLGLDKNTPVPMVRALPWKVPWANGPRPKRSACANEVDSYINGKVNENAIT